MPAKILRLADYITPEDRTAPDACLSNQILAQAILPNLRHYVDLSLDITAKLIEPLDSIAEALDADPDQTRIAMRDREALRAHHIGLTSIRRILATLREVGPQA